MHNVLLIEDNPGDARLIREMLAEAPAVSSPSPPTGSLFTVRCAERLSQGLDLLSAASKGGAAPALVLLDVNLPDMSGLEVARQIKSDPSHRHVKIIQISATFSTPRDQLHGLETGGADIYLAEPVARGTLLSVIHRLLDA